MVDDNFEIEMEDQELKKARIRELQFEVEQVKNIRENKDGLKYLIKWKRYSQSVNSWEPARNLRCDQLIWEFHLQRDTWCYICQQGFVNRKDLEEHQMRHEE